jgi:hypothetical protein
MAINPNDLNFSLRGRSMIIFEGNEPLCCCDLNGARDRIENMWMCGFETPEKRQIAGALEIAGNAYLDEIRRVQSSKHEIKRTQRLN